MREVAMVEELFEFQWQLNETGYRWLKTQSQNIGKRVGNTDLFLTDRVPLGSKYGMIQYSPLKDHTALFRLFAETEPTEDGILEFANEYGLLGGDLQDMIPVKSLGEGKSAAGIGETLRSWKNEIFTLRRAVTLWDLAEENDVEELSKIIHWTGPRTVVYEYGRDPKKEKDEVSKYWAGYSLIAMDEGERKRVHPELIDRFQYGELNLPVRYYIQKIINDRLKGLVFPQMLWERNRNRLSLYFVPSSLLGALWLQFAQAIDGDKKYRKCQECRKPYEISPETARTSKLFCSNACRSKNYRERQAKARKMNEEGKTLEFIAQDLRTDLDTARGWIEAKKGRK
jgi:hypothetical protein